MKLRIVALGHKMPAWVTAKISQIWTWPRHITPQGDGLSIDKRLVGWFPGNPAATQLQYALTVDRVEILKYDVVPD